MCLSGLSRYLILKSTFTFSVMRFSYIATIEKKSLGSDYGICKVKIRWTLLVFQFLFSVNPTPMCLKLRELN